MRLISDLDSSAAPPATTQSVDCLCCRPTYAGLASTHAPPRGRLVTGDRLHPLTHSAVAPPESVSSRSPSTRDQTRAPPLALAHLLPETRLVRRLYSSSSRLLPTPLSGMSSALSTATTAASSEDVSLPKPRFVCLLVTNYAVRPATSPVASHECGSSPTSTRLPARRRRPSRSTAVAVAPPTHAGLASTHAPPRERLVTGDRLHPLTHSAVAARERLFSLTSYPRRTHAPPVAVGRYLRLPQSCPPPSRRLLPPPPPRTCRYPSLNSHASSSPTMPCDPRHLLSPRLSATHLRPRLVCRPAGDDPVGRLPLLSPHLCWSRFDACTASWEVGHGRPSASPDTLSCRSPRERLISLTFYPLPDSCAASSSRLLPTPLLSMSSALSTATAAASSEDVSLPEPRLACLLVTNYTVRPPNLLSSRMSAAHLHPRLVCRLAGDEPAPAAAAVAPPRTSRTVSCTASWEIASILLPTVSGVAPL